MTVAFIVDSFPNASETFITRQIIGLEKAGYKVHIFAGAAAAPGAAEVTRVDPALLSRVRVFNAKPRNPVARVMAAFVMAPVFFCRTPLAFLNALNIFRYGAEAWSLNYYFQAWAFTQVRVDVTIAHFGPNGLVGARMKELKALPRKLFCFFHAYDLTSYIVRHGPKVYRQLFQQCTRAVAISEAGRMRLKELGCPAAKIILMHMGVSLGEYHPEPRNLDPGKPLRILSVARLVEKKGIIFGLEAMKILWDKGINAEYLILGDGPLREALESSALSLGIKSRVMFLGSRDADFVEKEMEAADIFLLPSTRAASGDEEGIPVVLMEALASGLPVVACDTGAVKELITDGETGVLVPAADPEKLAEGIQRLLQHPKAAVEMARAGRRKVEQDFNNRSLHRQLQSLLLIHH